MRPEIQKMRYEKFEQKRQELIETVKQARKILLMQHERKTSSVEMSPSINESPVKSRAMSRVSADKILLESSNRSTFFLKDCLQ